MKQNITYLVCFLLTIFITQPAFAQVQDKKITLPNAPVTGLKIVTAIKTQTGLRFNYAEALDTKLAVTVKTEGSQITVKTALELIKTTCGLDYEIDNEYVTLSQPAPKSPNASAGGGPGTLKGRIVEFETSQPLPGASVYIVELQKGMVSNNEGYYRFNNTPEGKYTLKVTYISYKTETIQVEVKTGKEENYDVKMQGSNSLQEVVVNSIRKSRAPVAHSTERQILTEIKYAQSVVSGISSEQISKTVDRNAAEVVRRISGITTVDDKFIVVRGLNQRYNLTYLNDNVAPSTEVNSRAFALDLIPSRIIDKILIYKSPQPENQGDATGGVVKIYTKDAKKVKHFDIEWQTGIRTNTSFNSNFLTYQGGKTDFWGFDDGTRKLPASVPGYNSLALASLTPSQYAKTFSPILNYGKKTALPNLQLTANYYNSFKVFGKSLSTLSSLSYKNEAQITDLTRSQLYQGRYASGDKNSNESRNIALIQLNLLQNFTLSLRDSSSISFKNFILQQGQTNTIDRVSSSAAQGSLTQSKDKDIILSYNQRLLYAGNLGGSHFYEKGKQHLQWNLGYTYSKQESPDQRVVRLTGNTSVSSVGDSSLSWRARGLSFGDDNGNPVALKLGIISRTWTRSSEGVYNASIDYTNQLKPWLSLKLGAYQQWKMRQLYRRVYTVHEGDVTTDKWYTYVPGTDHYVNPTLVRFHEQDLGNVWSPAYLRDDYSGLRVNDNTSGSDSYIGTEQNNSGYAALSIKPFGNMLDIYGGVRYEYNRQKIGAAIPKENNLQINVPILVDNPTRSWLPSLNISLRPDEKWVVRAAYGKTVNRTEFREVSPFEEQDYENNTILNGNPKLKSAKVENYDTRIEFYPKNNKGESFSVGAFYKKIQNPIERINTSDRTTPEIIPTISYQNAASGTIKGFEFEFRKSLDFIPLNAFRNFSIIANAALIKSETVNDTLVSASLAVADTGGRRPLQGQSPYVINAGLYYENAGLGTKVSLIYNVSGPNIYAASRGYAYSNLLDGPRYRGSLIELPRHLIDISVTQRLLKSLQLKIGVQNLLDQSVKMAEDINFTNKYEPLKHIAGQPPAKSIEGDNITSSYKPGRYFTFTFSYSL
ncbi:TonB-dependent receptor [Mucilaginibacter paludis]|uniref:TonB-dependent receptor n=1 Tax=Mucilaginibacter paludis DSM 18603 TaxID=714943 RepID=H1YHD6_9SPHI|nr:TonB-dependent receptor [Mucilaginibacter paludis]EHQ25470.1 TonB-dependent receptor [Mucilaginibacter paludis DSM 18603]